MIVQGNRSNRQGNCRVIGEARDECDSMFLPDDPRGYRLTLRYLVMTARSEPIRAS
jgi:hypothetical protein